MSWDTPIKIKCCSLNKNSNDIQYDKIYRKGMPLYQYLGNPSHLKSIDKIFKLGILLIQTSNFQLKYLKFQISMPKVLSVSGSLIPIYPCV